MTRRISVALIVLVLACLLPLSSASADNVTLNLTPVPLSDPFVSGLLIDGFGWYPSSLGSLASSVAGGGAYSPTSVVGFYDSNPAYLNVFPFLGEFYNLAIDEGLDGQFVGGWFAKSTYYPSEGDVITFNWNLALLKINSLDPPINTTALSQTLSFVAGDISGEGEFNVTGLGLVVVGLFPDEVSGNTYWLFGLLAPDLSGFNSPHPLSEEMAFFVSAPVPLPGAVWLLGTGLLGLAALRRRFTGRR